MVQPVVLRAFPNLFYIALSSRSGRKYSIGRLLSRMPKGNLLTSIILTGMGAYLTADFRQSLLAEYQQLKAADHLDRTRTVQTLATLTEQAAQVKALTANSWEVDLDVLLIEHAGPMVVKKARLRYPLKIVRFAVSHKFNPYGLAIAGYVRAPERLQKKSER